MNATAENLETLNAQAETHRRAFDLVCPRKYAAKLAAAGIISRAEAAAVSWKEQIAALVLRSELVAAGVTIQDVAAAVEFYTATKAMVSAERIGLRAHEIDQKVRAGRLGYLVMADGYAAGPAGDH